MMLDDVAAGPAARRPRLQDDRPAERPGRFASLLDARDDGRPRHGYVVLLSKLDGRKLVLRRRVGVFVRQSERTRVGEPLAFLRQQKRQLVATRNDEVDPALLGRAQKDAQSAFRIRPRGRVAQAIRGMARVETRAAPFRVGCDHLGATPPKRADHRDCRPTAGVCDQYASAHELTPFPTAARPLE